MKIVFLNVWGEEMRDALLPYIQEQTINTDIFCFQEASDEMKSSSAQLLVDYKEISGNKYITDKDNFPQSIFVRKDLEILSSGTLFANDMNVGLAVYVEIRHENGSIYICNAHGHARPSDKLDSPDRLRFSSELIKFFDTKKAQIIIGGDFNLEPATQSIKMFEEYSYKNLIKEFDIKTTRNHFAWDKYPGHAMYYSDYVFLNDKVQFKNFFVQDNEISDHLPLILEIKD